LEEIRGYMLYIRRYASEGLLQNIASYIGLFGKRDV